MGVQPLSFNQLIMPADFPAAACERVYARIHPLRRTHAEAHEQFIGAWHALAYRFLTVCEEGEAFTVAIAAEDAGNSHYRRFEQEKHLFGLFSNGFAAFEALFYGLFAIGNILVPADFPILTPREQQGVSPSSTERAFKKAFAGDPILAAIEAVFTDPQYSEWREIRNILTHRRAPGRIISVAFDDAGAPLADRWKINDITLDQRTAGVRQAILARLLDQLVAAVATFVEARFP